MESNDIIISEVLEKEKSDTSITKIDLLKGLFNNHWRPLYRSSFTIAEILVVEIKSELLKSRELEQENGQLKLENESLRNQIAGLKDDTEYELRNFEAKNSLL